VSRRMKFEDRVPGYQISNGNDADVQLFGQFVTVLGELFSESFS